MSMISDRSWVSLPEYSVVETKHPHQSLGIEVVIFQFHDYIEVQGQLGLVKSLLSPIYNDDLCGCILKRKISGFYNDLLCVLYTRRGEFYDYIFSLISF